MLDMKLAASLFAILLAAPALARATQGVSIGSGSAQCEGPSHWSSISADGRCAVSWSAATNLVADDTNGFADVFVHDGGTGTTSRVSVATDGAQGNGESYDPSISPDGRYVAFWSFASNLDVGDTNGLPDVFVHDRRSGATSRAVRVLAPEARFELGQAETADSIRLHLRSGEWLWTDASDEDPESPLLMRGSEHAGASEWSNDSRPTLGPVLPGDFLLTAPLDGATPVGISPIPITLSWTASSDHDSYMVEIANNTSFATLAFSYPVAGNITSHDLQPGLLQYDHVYYWRVRAINSAGTTVASNAPFQFTMTTPNQGGGVDDTMGFCFVATAAYGSPMEPEVETLRTFRDRVLTPTAPGRAFVAWYYRNSPPLANAIAARPSWRTAARALLWPVVGIANVVLWADGEPLAATGLACALLAVAWFAARRVGGLRRSRALARA